MRAEKKAYKLVRERLTICRRDIVKMIEAGIEEGVPANWGTVQQAYQAIVGRLPRTAPRQVLEAVAAELDELWAEIREVLVSFVKSTNTSANESQTERHIQNSNTEAKSESERGLGKRNEASSSAGETDNVRSLPRRELPLGIVLDACPNILWLVKGGGGIRNWREFMAAAETARPVLGISPSAWERVADAGGVDRLMGMITTCRLDGDKRYCTMADGSEIVEEVIAVDHANRRISYTIAEGPIPFAFHSGSMQVHQNGAGSRLVWIFDFKPDGLTEAVAPMLDMAADSIRTALA